MNINVNNIYGIHHKMLDKKILMAYKGAFSIEIVNALLSNAKRQMKNLDIDFTVRKKIYNVMVECLENINRYAGENLFEEKDQLSSHIPLFLMGKSEGCFYVTVGNLIYNKDVDLLKQKLDDINKLDRKGLKEKYRDTILKAKVTEKTGPGLGIIDMALKSDNKLDYYFKTVKDDISFFVLEIKV
ncbi:MAG: SiaB family protein kinase [Bacteroidota bacterium]